MADIFIVVAIVLSLAAYILQDKKESLRKIWGFLFELTLKAEDKYGSGTGAVKKAYVMFLILDSEFYKGLPRFVKGFLSEETLSDLIDKFIAEIFNVARETNKNIEELLAR